MKAIGPIGARIILLAALTSVSSEAAAQDPVRSFGELQPMLKTGQRLIVTGSDGGKTRGRFVSIGTDRMELRRTRWIFREEQRIFTEESVWIVADDDSDWNGTLIGLGAGSLILLVGASDCADLACGPVLLAPIAGMLAGSLIDRAHSRPLYLSPRSTIALSPILAPRAIGVAANVRF